MESESAFIEILATIGLIAIIYFVYKILEKENNKKHYKQRQKQFGRALVRRYSTNEWDSFPLFKLNPTEQDILQAIIEPEDFSFRLNLPNSNGSISIIRYSEKWELGYVPKGGAVNIPHGIHLSENSLKAAFKTGDNFYNSKLKNKELTVREFNGF